MVLKSVAQAEHQIKEMRSGHKVVQHMFFANHVDGLSIRPWPLAR